MSVPSSIAFVSNHGAVGGGEAMLLRMAIAARDAGIVVTVLAPGRDTEVRAAASAAGIACREVGGGGRGGQLVRMARALRACEADVVWCNGVAPGLSGVVTRHVRVVHLHQPPSPRLAPLARLVARGATMVVVPSRTVQREVPGSTVLENWTDEVPLHLRSPVEGTLRVGFLGRLSTIKGVDVLARAVGRMDAAAPGSVELVVGGDDRFVPREAAEPVRRAMAQVASCTAQLGWVEPSRVLERVDVLVVPSRWAEPFGLVVAEAMSARVPVVVSDAGALPSLVGADHPWIFPAGDDAALAQLLWSIAASPGQASASADRMRLRWERRYAPAPGRERFVTLLERAFDGGGEAPAGRGRGGI